jgi:phosphate/sulfate permease
MEINCEALVEKYLLNLNPLYAFGFPLAILVGIVLFGFSKAYNWTDNSYINQILIPILSFLLTLVLIDIIARLMINKEKKMELVKLCKTWVHNPNNKNNILNKNNVNMDLILNTNNKNFEYYTNNDNTENENTDILIESYKNDKFVESPISEIPNIFPQSLEAKNNGSKCIQDSNCCNICSGSSNSCNLIAPIPGPQWLPESAETVQNRLKNNDYTKGHC